MAPEIVQGRLAQALTQLKSAFESELRIVADAELQLAALASATDEQLRVQASVALRDQLRLLARTNAAISGFVKSATDAARL